jgi:glycogen debranching enzyme
MVPQELTTTEEAKFHIHAEAVNNDDRVKVLNHADSFAIFDRWGDIHPYTKKAQGIFHQGTRFLNRLELRLNKKKPLLLSSSIKEDNDVLSVDLTNPDLTDCGILENSLHLSRSQFIRNGVYYEEISIINYGETECKVELSIAFGSDFKDLFEIRGIPRTLEPNKHQLHHNKNGLVYEYHGLDNITRATEIVFLEGIMPEVEHSLASFFLELYPHQKQKIDYLIAFKTEENFFSTERKQPSYTGFEEIKKSMQTELQKAHVLFASISTSNEQFTHWVHRSKADLISLITQTPYGMYPYAGVPWYNTAFGRDGIITAMEVLWIAPEIAKNALFFLAHMQAKELIPSKDAEPGKILHEARSGEMANTGEIPFKEYYGTIDATPLFVMLAGMYYQHTADIDTIKKLWPNIKAALNWIDNYGDLDRDGFVEYKHKAENGLTNQGWKDSHDSVMYKNGELCVPPIALCEVQGYVYAAKNFASLLAEELNEKDFAIQLAQEANELKQKFNEVFWDEELSCYALALDGNKKPCKVVSSNAGHCLFCGIVDEDKVSKLAATLTSTEMFSGWGIRTLSECERRYNPMSYHNGSIWPHDNAIIASGLARYGFQKEAAKILSALFDASLFIELQRLPELYCGFSRRVGEGPTSYPVACSPQAWSVGAVFMLLQACLQVEINAVKKTIVFNKPELPVYLERISISNLQLGTATCDLELYRHEYDVAFNVIRKPTDWSLLIIK